MATFLHHAVLVVVDHFHVASVRSYIIYIENVELHIHVKYS